MKKIARRIALVAWPLGKLNLSTETSRKLSFMFWAGLLLLVKALVTATTIMSSMRPISRLTHTSSQLLPGSDKNKAANVKTNHARPWQDN